MNAAVRQKLASGVVIPAHPLALTSQRKLDERRQRGLSRYYAAAGAGGLAVGVHTTQFEIREEQYGLLRPVLQLAAEEFDRTDAKSSTPMIRIAGICGPTSQAIKEASLAYDLRYHAGLLSLSALQKASDDELIDHCRAVASVLPIVGFYLQPAAGGRLLSYQFWRRFAEIPNVVAIKMAPFNRYQTIDVVRAIAESGRDDIALYTGNDDNIVLDLLTLFRFESNGRIVERRVVGGLLGHWCAWTRRAVELLNQCHDVVQGESGISPDMLSLAIAVTDSNAVLFDAANGFSGCIPGVHEVLRRQGLLEGTWCLDESLDLSPGQSQELDRIYASYPYLTDDAFVAKHRDEWLNG
jgi:hypothetical protein